MYVKLKLCECLTTNKVTSSLKSTCKILDLCRITSTQLHEHAQYRSNAFSKPMQDKKKKQIVDSLREIKWPKSAQSSVPIFHWIGLACLARIALRELVLRHESQKYLIAGWKVAFRDRCLSTLCTAELVHTCANIFEQVKLFVVTLAVSRDLGKF